MLDNILISEQSTLPGVEAVSLPDNLSTGAIITDTGVQQTATGDPTVRPVPNTGITPVVVIDLKCKPGTGSL